ncbi:MAG: ligand-gated TonB-dependent outer rane channel [Verrucomicrobiales bacterium]|nr:ligand-gated TonB-dependent outer rane channel [Verrucomicrobiales bacterium]
MKLSFRPLAALRARLFYGLSLILGSFFMFSATILAAEKETETISVDELKMLSLEQLMNIDVISVAKHPQKMAVAPAAISVITQDDIQRSGATSIPEALRMAPGFDVARIDGHRYAVNARGFNNEYANKLLVLMDGRSIYTPLFSGVFWDQQDMLMEDIDRIEAIRGPGGTLWGANAVNGVINIISKSAKDTQGTLISGGGGTEERWFGSVRYGAKAGENTYLRVYGKTFDRDDLAGGDLAKGWQHNQGGFRLDWSPSDDNAVTFQGDIYSGTASETDLLPLPSPLALSQAQNKKIDYHGGNVLSRWTHTWSEEAQSQLQCYVDRIDRDTLTDDKRTTGDLDFQHRFAAGERQQFIVGAGYRVSSDDTEPGNIVNFTPVSRTTQLFSTFAQDEIKLVPEQLSFTLGTKLEHNDFTGFELQPSARLAWTPNARNILWTSVSRATRTPSRLDNDVNTRAATVPGPVAIRAAGNPDMDSEELIAYELGYRTELHQRVTLDTAVFYNDYDKLSSQEFGAFNPATTPPTQTLFTGNGLRGETYGVELSLRWKPTAWWTLRPSYTFLEMQLHTKPGSTDSTTEKLTEGRSPHHQASVLSSMTFARKWDFDVWVRYVDNLSSLSISSYVTTDVRVAWRPTKHLELAVVGQNLLQPRHPEFFEQTFGVAGRPAEVERSVYGKITWRF